MLILEFCCLLLTLQNATFYSWWERIVLASIDRPRSKMYVFACTEPNCLFLSGVGSKCHKNIHFLKNLKCNSFYQNAVLILLYWYSYFAHWFSAVLLMQLLGILSISIGVITCLRVVLIIFSHRWQKLQQKLSGLTADNNEN